MAGFRIEGNSSGNVAEVNSNGEIKVALSNTVATIGGVRMFSENDNGTVTGTPYLKSPETSPDYRLRVGTDTLLMTDTFNATTQNTTNWAYVFATMTAAQPGAGTVNFSNVQGTTSAHGAYMRSFQYFPMIGTAPLAIEFTAGVFTAPLVTNEIWLMGLGIPVSAVAPPTDGVWLKCTSAGWTGVIIYNGTTTESGVLWDAASIVLSDLQKWTIVVGEQEVEFWRNDQLLGKLVIPAANGQPFINGALPVFMHKYNTGAVSNTNTMRVSDVTVSLMDLASNRDWPITQVIQGLSSIVGTNGNTQGKTSLWANNTAPTAVALTNTTAAFVGLGGIAAVLPTLAANSDGILFSYQNPVGSINITPRNLVINSIELRSVVSVVLAGGPVIYAYAVAFGHTAVSLATAETASFATGTTHAPRIIPLGIESHAATAAVGSLGTGATIALPTPIVVRPGEFIAIVARNLGTVTTTGAITVLVSFNGYWE